MNKNMEDLKWKTDANDLKKDSKNTYERRKAFGLQYSPTFPHSLTNPAGVS